MSRFSQLKSKPTVEFDLPPKLAIAPDVVQAGVSLSLSEIIVEDRIRQYFDEAKTQELATSIREFGFRGTLWVRQKEGKYYLVAGGRRYAACQVAGVNQVPVDVITCSNLQAMLLEVAENSQRQDLNPLEETIGVLRILEESLQIPREEVVSLFHWKARQPTQSGNSASANIDVRSQEEGIPFLLNQVETTARKSSNEECWAVVEAVFGMVGKISPASFRTQRLPLLNLPDSLKEAISSGQLEYSKARLIGAVSDETLRDQLLKDAITQGWSQAEIKEQIAATSVVEYKGVDLSDEQRLKGEASTVLKRLKKAKLEGRSLKKAQNLVSQLNDLLEGT
jgi:ParB family transcriptional regulator, chromosome partitioning protein